MTRLSGFIRNAPKLFYVIAGPRDELEAAE